MVQYSTTVDRTFAALADPTRRAVVELLGSGPRRAGELAAAAGTSPPTMSRHLRVLLAAGIELFPDPLEVRPAAAAAQLAGDDLPAPGRHELDPLRVAVRAPHRRNSGSHSDQLAGS